MMDKRKNLYLVSSSNGRKFHVWAASGDQAKRAYCREYGLRPSDHWCGLSTLTARKLKPEEVKAWEDDADAKRATYLFIHGMLEIGAKAYAALPTALPCPDSDENASESDFTNV